MMKTQHRLKKVSQISIWYFWTYISNQIIYIYNLLQVVQISTKYSGVEIKRGQGMGLKTTFSFYEKIDF